MADAIYQEAPSWTPRGELSDAERSGLEGQLDRLVRLQGTDPGFFILAVHAFVEAHIRRRIEFDDPDEDRFWVFAAAYHELLCRGRPSPPPGIDVLDLLRHKHKLTNNVRHCFGIAPAEEAREATQHLRRFCSLSGFGQLPGLKRLEGYLAAWDEKRCSVELQQELAQAINRLRVEQQAARDLTARVSRLEAAQSEFDHLREQRRILERELEELKRRRQEKNERVDELRSERNRLTGELREARKKLDELEDVRTYVDTLSRLTLYTRTRFDYERTITRLTAEQKGVLRQITLAKDFLVKGSAGTGKTLVLLKAIEKAKGLASGDQGLLDLPDLAGPVALLTYNNTLVRYDQYVGDILCGQNPADRVCTADSFLYEKLRLVDPDFRVDYDIARELAAEHPVDGLSERELAAEVDGFIWGNDLTFAEYVEEGIERRGMKRPLNRQQRAAVWRSAEAMERAMRERKVLARCLAARIVALEAAARPEDAAMRSVDYTFIDEVQDLPVAVLRALRACTRKCAVLAGDADQSIYQAGFTFRRAGIDVGGRSKILRTNFRNTVQLHQAAERFRAACPGMDGENQPEAFRDGPPPELFTAPTSEGLREVLLQRVDLFLVRLGYDPENLCVVAPTDSDLKALKRALEERGYAVSDIRDREFVFSTAGTIRLSTLHSVKGLDFPVVLLYLPRLHLGDGGHDEETAERLHRNLVYVALTRAMDHLNVFLPEETDSAVLRDLVGCFGGEGARG